MTAPRPSSGGRKSPRGYSRVSPAACVTGCSPPPTPAAPSSAAGLPPQSTRTPASPLPARRKTSRPSSAGPRPSTPAGPRSRPRRRPRPPSWTRPATSTVTRALFSRPCSTTRRRTARPPRTAPAPRRPGRRDQHRPVLPPPPAPDVRQRRQPPRSPSRPVSRTRPVTAPTDPSTAESPDPPLPRGSTTRTRTVLTRAPARKKTSQPPRRQTRPRPARPERAGRTPGPPPGPPPVLLTTMTPSHRRCRPRTATSRSPCTTCPARS